MPYRRILKHCFLEKANSSASTGPQWTAPLSKQAAILSENPSTEEPIATVDHASKDDYEHVLSDAETAFRSWQLIPAPKRGDVIRQIGETIRQQKSELAHLIALEVGKTLAEAEGEVQEVIDMADYATGLSRMLNGKILPSERPEHRLMEQWHPIGPIVVITAFNFPMAVWAWNAFIAAICGNTVIWKPSPKAPLCAWAIQKICNSVMNQLDLQGIFSLLISEQSALMHALIEDPRVSLVSFTGSSEIGSMVQQTVIKRFGRSILECSGNNAIIIDETANLDLAIPAIYFSAIGTTGQRCTTARRLILHHSLFDQVVTALSYAYRHTSIGNPLQKHHLMGPLIDRKAIIAYQAAIEATKHSGGEILYGGQILDQPGYFVTPTLMQAENQWPIVQKETFAPILYVIPYDDFEEAIALQNQAPQGLSSALFTTNLQRAEYYLSTQGSDCGIANINVGTSGAEIGGAFGGEKITGGGREAGSDAWKNYMRRQTNTINWGATLPLAQGITFKIPS